MPRDPATLADTLSRAYGHAGAVRRVYDRIQKHDAWAALAAEFVPDPREAVRRAARTEFWFTVLQSLHHRVTIQ